MLCITEIKVVDVERDFIEICHKENLPPIAPVLGSDPVEYAEVKTEVVRGRIFIGANGQRLCIGMSEQVQNLIGLPFDAFEKMESELEVNRITIAQLRSRSAMFQSRLKDYEEAGFLKRLRYLFIKTANKGINSD